MLVDILMSVNADLYQNHSSSIHFLIEENSRLHLTDLQYSILARSCLDVWPLNPTSLDGPKVFAMPGGMIKSNGQLVDLIERVKPEIRTLIEKCNTVCTHKHSHFSLRDLFDCFLSALPLWIAWSGDLLLIRNDSHLYVSHSQVKMWVQLLIPRIEDGNNFGVSIQVLYFPINMSAETCTFTYLASGLLFQTWTNLQH